MFQSFDERGERAASPSRVAALRAQFDDLGIDAFLVPHADEYGSEYVPECAERLAWLSGFTGSAGFALITRDAAHIFSDGRYTLQLEAQTDAEVWTPHTVPDEKLSDVLREADVRRLGVDPWLHTVRALSKLSDNMEGGKVVRLPVNPIDLTWSDRPPTPQGAVTMHRFEHAGVLAKTKIENVRNVMAKAGVRAHIVSDPLSTAWLFNVRGEDVVHNPVPLVRAIVYLNKRPTVFVNERRLPLSARAYLTQIADLAPEDAFPRAATAIADSGPVLIDHERCPDAIRALVEWGDGTVVHGADPALVPRAIKNETEIDGARAAHRRDGAAMATFLAWLDTRETGTVTEIEAAERLERIRRETGERLGEPLREIAFDTISGSGPNGAIVHYRVSRATDRALGDGELYLVDSGGQYLDGTTDITRTVAVGEPAPKMCTHFTLVLKGMIAISRLRFPEGTEGRQIDAIARAALWQEGLDYAHGTGHGVGSYGAVHEGPQGISKRSAAPLEAGMIVSNEPGYYRAGEYGIRIENLLLCSPAEQMAGGETDMMAFETLTLCPIDRRLIDPTRLSAAEREWLDAYHARVERELRPLVADDAVRAWLREACKSLETNAVQNAPPTEARLLAADGAVASLPERTQHNDGGNAQADHR